MYCEFEKLLFSFGTQLYHLDVILNDSFDKVFNHSYLSFVQFNDETKQEWEEIEKMQESHSIELLLKKIISQCDYHNLHKIKWMLTRYDETHKKYKIMTKPTLEVSLFSDDFKNRENELKSLGLDSFRKSNLKNIHKHYWFWIDNLMNPECNYSTWVFKYNDTHMFDMFHLSNYGDKNLVEIILKYITDNNIIEDQTKTEATFEIFHPMFNNVEFKHSSNMGGMWYSIYLTVNELKEIYTKIGSRKAKNLGCYEFFSYINAMKDDYSINRFYFYFKE